jgi:hypothetical protein
MVSPSAPGRSAHSRATPSGSGEIAHTHDGGGETGSTREMGRSWATGRGSEGGPGRHWRHAEGDVGGADVQLETRRGTIVVATKRRGLGEGEGVVGSGSGGEIGAAAKGGKEENAHALWPWWRCAVACAWVLRIAGRLRSRQRLVSPNASPSHSCGPGERTRNWWQVAWYRENSRSAPSLRKFGKKAFWQHCLHSVDTLCSPWQ